MNPLSSFIEKSRNNRKAKARLQSTSAEVNFTLDEGKDDIIEILSKALERIDSLTAAHALIEADRVARKCLKLQKGVKS